MPFDFASYESKRIQFMSRLLYTAFLMILFGCNQFAAGERNPIVARVGAEYLYEEDLKRLLPEKTSPTDSVAIAKSIINSWARNQLYFQQAVLQLDNETQTDLNQLINEYRLDLWASTYKEQMVKSRIDTLITEAAIQTYFDENQMNFKLKEDLVQARFIVLPKDNKDLDLIKTRFLGNAPEDRAYLDSLSFQFTHYEIKDSIWFTPLELNRFFPEIEPPAFEEYLKKSQFFVIENPIEVYLLLIKDIRKRGDFAPFSKIRNTLRKIVFNRRKLEIIKSIDQEILNDAIQTNTFEIYP